MPCCNAPWIFLVRLVPCISAPIPPPQYIPDEYIVQLKPELSIQDVLDQIPGGSVKREYTIGSLHFAMLKIDNELFDPTEDIGFDLIPNIVVEGYQDMKPPEAVCYKQETGRKYWGLTRISHVDMPHYNDDDSYLFNETAECVDIYMMDTGVNIEHETFGGRAYRGFTAEEILIAEGTEDRSGHGTHVAGLAAGNTSMRFLLFFNHTLLCGVCGRKVKALDQRSRGLANFKALVMYGSLWQVFI